MPGAKIVGVDRLTRERATVAAMVRIFCEAHHGGRTLCRDCAALLEYANYRLDRCPFDADKPTCVVCPIHCYRAVERERMREVMRYAGPRMLWRHPYLAIRHLLDERRDRRALRRGTAQLKPVRGGAAAARR